MDSKPVLAMSQEEKESLRYKLLSSPLHFTKVFYELRTGRPFKISKPISREPHIVTIYKHLVKVFIGEIQFLNINIPPRYGKTESIIHFIAWALARYPDSNFIYVSYSHSLASKQTQIIRSILEMPEYYKLFGTRINPDISAKDNFETTQGGSVFAAGAMGPITGRGAGIRYSKRCGGFAVIDDIIKPVEALSENIREQSKDWLYNTLLSRLNNPDGTGLINICQRTHEDDPSIAFQKLPGCVNLILPALDSAGNALDPEMHDVHKLKEMQKLFPYEFAAQYQQNPQPAGGGIFKPEFFKVLSEEPKIIATFITIDTAETDKTYNDATVFSFWGLYEINEFGHESDIWGLHWINCWEMFIEPKDLESQFIQFATQCFTYKIKPAIVGIETKSTGVTLASVLKTYQGLRIIEFKPSGRGNNLINCMIDIQSYVNRGLISLPQYAPHTEMCIEHCRKITANNTHRRDDIGVTLYYAIKLALIDKLLNSMIVVDKKSKDTLEYLSNQNKHIQYLRKNAGW